MAVYRRPQVYGSGCTEIDIWEANKQAMAYTMHSSSPGNQTRCEGVDCGDSGEDRFKHRCDKNIQQNRLGQINSSASGSSFTIDSTKPITVTTQFITNVGTDDLIKKYIDDEKAFFFFSIFSQLHDLSACIFFCNLNRLD